MLQFFLGVQSPTIPVTATSALLLAFSAQGSLGGPAAFDEVVSLLRIRSNRNDLVRIRSNHNDLARIRSNHNVIVER